MPLKLVEQVNKLIKTSEKFTDKEQNLYISKILEAIEQIDSELIKLLISDEKIKNHFFTKIEDVYVLNQNKLIEFFTINEYSKNSYTSYTNKIGLIKKDSFIKKFDDVVLAWPHKDCILEGGQSRDDEKNNEVFYNEILSSDEIDRLFEPKALTNIKRYTKDGMQENPQITEDDNLIIKGNNLIALHSLKKKYAGKVKLIYIDPPYNTGNDSFKYNDRFNHSTWLTFMKNRLEVAREFLSEDGSIYINIDYNETHYLKILMDEIFGRECFQREIIWRIGWLSGYKTIAKNYIRNHDTILFYTKNSNNFLFNKVFNTKKDYMEKFNESQKKEIVKKFEELDIDKSNNNKLLDFITNLGYPEKYPIEDTWNCSIYDKLNSIAVVSFSGEKVSKMLGTDEIKGQKSEALLKRIIEISTNKNDLVMDFHLGSGTTCAVAHKMGRRYIGIEQMDYIEDIAVERMKKVIEGEQSGISKTLTWQGGGSFVYAELKQIDTFKDAEIGKLNKNMQYLPVSEIEDEEYKISKEEIKINKAFYGLDNE
ncbi:site-specific DNA-methyltransferase [Sulfurimonas sp.]|uniref:DNA methyltransferase n=1 Tax=Sulfurimonas sp. TaxID=2022749 RepID=UPI00262314AF|nr:site-specific DNA-methyltransferase [Sulfurimonas sp.]MCW8895749.1 site-specific DNA-methyltransferase [Sulfurimonas sp.]